MVVKITRLEETTDGTGRWKRVCKILIDVPGDYSSQDPIGLSARSGCTLLCAFASGSNAQKDPLPYSHLPRLSHVTTRAMEMWCIIQACRHIGSC
jgi:hypothetical protein